MGCFNRFETFQDMSIVEYVVGAYIIIGIENDYSGFFHCTETQISITIFDITSFVNRYVISCLSFRRIVLLFLLMLEWC